MSLCPKCTLILIYSVEPNHCIIKENPQLRVSEPNSIVNESGEEREETAYLFDTFLQLFVNHSGLLKVVRKR